MVTGVLRDARHWRMSVFAYFTAGLL